MPVAVSITINCSEFASQTLEVELASQKAAQGGCSHHGNNSAVIIDFCIGSQGGDPLIAQKRHSMRCLQLEGYRVHVDYSGEMDANLTEHFLRENNVRFVLVQLQNDTLVCKDRLGYFSASQQTFGSVKDLIIEMDKQAAQLQANTNQQASSQQHQIMGGGKMPTHHQYISRRLSPTDKSAQ